MEPFKNETERRAYMLFFNDYRRVCVGILCKQLCPIDMYTAQERYEKLSKSAIKMDKLKNRPIATAIYRATHNSSYDYGTVGLDGTNAQDYKFLINLMLKLGVDKLGHDQKTESYFRLAGINQSPYQIFKKYYEPEYTKDVELENYNKMLSEISALAEAEPGNE